MRCPDCNKFVSMETECDDPENEDLSCNKDGYHLTFDVTINRNCADCGQTLKSLAVSFVAEDKPEHWPEEPTDPEVSFSTPDVTESGGGRYAKNMIGANVEFTISVGGMEFSDTVHAEEPASSFEEQV